MQSPQKMPLIEINQPALLENIALSVKPLGLTLLEEATGLGEFEELCWHYLHIFPAPYQIGQIKTRLIEENYEAEIRAEGPGGGSRLEFDSRLFKGEEAVGQIMVSLYRRPDAPNEIYLELEQGQIWQAELRGQGLGRMIAENVIALGKALGVRSITLFAMYDGRFIWPKLGFQFGDYLPEPEKATRFRRSFRAFCQRHAITPPDTDGWNAADFAHFLSDKEAYGLVGHRNDRRLQKVNLGHAFLLSRHPFFLCYPL